MNQDLPAVSRRDRVAYAKVMTEPSPKPVPTYVMLYLAGPAGPKRLYKVDPFDEAETMAAFQALQARFPQEVITLLVDTDEALTKASLSLNAGGQTIPLAKSRVQPFDLD